MPPKYHHTVERWACPLCNGNLALDTSVTLQEWSPGDLSVGPLGPTPGGFGPLGPTPRNLGPLGRTPQMVPPPKRPRQPLVAPPSAARQPRGTMIKDDSISVKGPCTPPLAFVINSGGLLRGTDALDHRKPKLCIAAAAVAAVAAAFAAAAAPILLMVRTRQVRTWPQLALWDQAFVTTTTTTTPAKTIPTNYFYNFYFEPAPDLPTRWPGRQREQLVGRGRQREQRVMEWQSRFLLLSPNHYTTTATTTTNTTTTIAGCCCCYCCWLLLAAAQA